MSSPLARALHTADLAFPASKVPRIMLPIARERLYLSSDVGQPRQGPIAHVLFECLLLLAACDHRISVLCLQIFRKMASL